MCVQYRALCGGIFFGRERFFKPATASDSTRTQEYTAVICIAERSVTFFPAVELPVKKRYALPAVLFLGLSLDLNSPEKILMKFHLS